MTKYTDKMHRVWVKSGEGTTRVLLAKFAMELDAQQYAAQLKRNNPTWSVEVR